MKLQLFCALLAASLGLCAAPVIAVPATEAHEAGDGHDHGASARGEESLSDYLWRRSDAAFHAGDYPRAVALHRAIVTVDPGDVESYGVATWLLWSMDKKDEADAFIAQGLKHNPDSAAMWEAAGAHYGLAKNYARERDAYAKSLALSGAGADQMLRRRYAHAAENAGDLPASATAWRALVADFPGEAVNKNNLARVEAALAAQTDPPAAGALGVGALALLGIGAWKARKRR